YGLLKKRRPAEVMLCRFDRVEGKGLYGLAGFTELDDKTPTAVATLILQRLAVNEGNSKDYYTRDAPTRPHCPATPPSLHSPARPDWPEIAPSLDWPVADHSEAQRAFAQLITQATPFRILLIHGSSETGKSHLSKQCLRNSFKIQGLSRGRFDFKGSSDMDNE